LLYSFTSGGVSLADAERLNDDGPLKAFLGITLLLLRRLAKSGHGRKNARSHVRAGLRRRERHPREARGLFIVAGGVEATPQTSLERMNQATTTQTAKMTVTMETLPPRMRVSIPRNRPDAST
jgi:hypothetical protein